MDNTTDNTTDKWTQDRRTIALMTQAVRHFNDTDELSLGHEVELEAIRDEYVNDCLDDYRGETTEDFEAWHGQPTVEQAFHAELKRHAANNAPIGNDPKTKRMIEDAYFGSKNLCAAILATGKTHGPMTPEQMIAAVEYAHSVKMVGLSIMPAPNKPPRTLRLTDWNTSK